MRIDKKKFILDYGTEIQEKHKMQASYLFDEYKSCISLYISLIQEWSAKKISKKRIQLALRVSNNVFKVSQLYFPEFKDALQAKEVVMDLVAQKSLIDAINLNPIQPKLVEMQLKRYDEEWVKKGSIENQLNIPRKISIEILDKKLSDEELKAYRKTIKE